MSDNKLVSKANALNEAAYTINLVAQRVIILAIIEAREQGVMSKVGGVHRIKASDYQKHFGCDKTTSYRSLKSACESLYESEFVWTDKDARGNTKVNHSRFVQRASYSEGGGYIEVMFGSDVIPLITRLSEKYTEYELKQIKDLSSIYALRIFEILMQWFSVRKTPEIKIEDLRARLGIEDHQYKTMGNFKKRVLDHAIREINDNTNITASYEQHKEGRNIVAFTFYIKVKKDKSQKKKTDGLLGTNAENGDLFTVKGLSDKQLGRIARNPQFIADYNHLVSSTSPAGQDTKVWEFEMMNRLKKDASQFNRRPIQEYLDY